jgi:hypothetical protein
MSVHADHQSYVNAAAVCVASCHMKMMQLSGSCS